MSNNTIPTRISRFHNVYVVLNFIGSTCFVLTGVLLIPLIVAFITGEIHEPYLVKAFVYPAILSAVLGVFLMGVFKGGPPNRLQAMLICGIGWVTFSAVGALPYVMGLNASFVDSFFEAVSGFTTTGITMFVGLDAMPKTILFWRSFTQWVGGLGILTFFLAVAFRGGSAHKLFGAESHKIEVRRPVPGLVNTIKILWSIYAGFTGLIIFLLGLAGMSVFDSVCHGFTALSTGGFSPHDASIGYYSVIGHPHYILIEYILILGMILGGTNFLIHYRVLKGEKGAVFDNIEMKYWWGLICGFVAIICVERLLRGGVVNAGIGIEEVFRTVLFQVSAIITTTGFGTADIGGPFFGYVAQQLFLVMMVIGGCVGSTGGGIKVLRIAILQKLIKRELYRLRSPRKAVSTVVIDGNPVELDEIQRVSALFFMWIVLLVIGGVVTAWLSGLDSYQSISGMFSAMGNIGPCYIPVETITGLHPVVKVVYTFGMLAGRLEILPVLLLFSPGAWISKGRIRR
jgi:trk system potassium uptake protein TrkH